MRISHGLRERGSRMPSSSPLRMGLQHPDEANLATGRGVAVRKSVLEKGHGRVDYLLLVAGRPARVIDAKPEVTILVEVERLGGKYVESLRAWKSPPVYPPFIQKSTGAGTRFINGYDTDARSRSFISHRSETRGVEPADRRDSPTPLYGRSSLQCESDVVERRGILIYPTRDQDRGRHTSCLNGGGRGASPS